MAAPEPSSRPSLTPQFCLNTTALRDFLRLSRATVDDSISAHLNALLSPSRSNPFQPSTTASKSLSTDPRTNQNIPGTTCRQFKQKILFPGWHTREQVLEYCRKVADTPASSLRSSTNNSGTLFSPSEQSPTQSVAGTSADPRISRNYWGKEQVVDERTDPYSARDYGYTRETETQILKDVLQNEEGVERIVRSRTWNVLRERCLNDRENGDEKSWEGEWREWKRKSGER